MFTGIVQAIGKIAALESREQDARIQIATANLDMGDVGLGDSIAVNGVCLTVIEHHAAGFSADVSAATLRCTTGLALNAAVNLEKALRLADRLGGHLVSGHVDGVGEVLRFEAVGESYLLQVAAPAALAKYIAAKGSITINGVSLTVNTVAEEVFSVNLVPHTLTVTTLQSLRPGAQVNLEVDLLARYAERLLHYVPSPVSDPHSR